MCSQHQSYTLSRARRKGLGQVVDGDRGERGRLRRGRPQVSLIDRTKARAGYPCLGGQVGQPASLQATQRQGRGARESAAAVPRRHDARRLARLTAASGGGGRGLPGDDVEGDAAPPQGRVASSVLSRGSPAGRPPARTAPPLGLPARGAGPRAVIKASNAAGSS